MLSNIISPQSLLDSQKSSSSAIIEYPSDCPAPDSQMSASQNSPRNSQYPSSLELFSQNGSVCSAPLPIAHLTKSLGKPTSDSGDHPRTKTGKKHYMKYLSAGPLSVNTVTHRGSSQPAAGLGSASKSTFEDWKAEKSNDQIIKNLESTMKTILSNTNELTKSICTLQASFNKANEQQNTELESLSTQVNDGFNLVQEKFKQFKSEDDGNKLLINKLLDEIDGLKKDITKRDKQLEEIHKEIVELKSGNTLTESIKKTFQVTLKEFFTAETLKLLSNHRQSQVTPCSGNFKLHDNEDEQRSEALDHQARETIPLSCQEQVPVVPDISSHQQTSAHSNSSFNSPASEWPSDFPKSSGQKRTYSQRITISRKISPAVISPMVSTRQREYGTWGGDTSSSDHDTIEVTQLASFTRKVRRKPKAANASEEQKQNAAICDSWQQNNYKKQKTHSTQAVVPVGRFKRSTEARKRRILCDNNDAELLQISASIRQQQMNKQLKL